MLAYCLAYGDFSPIWLNPTSLLTTSNICVR